MLPYFKHPSTASFEILTYSLLITTFRAARCT